jgi:hypothetical protein
MSIDAIHGCLFGEMIPVFSQLIYNFINKIIYGIYFWEANYYNNIFRVEASGTLII